MGPKNKKKLEKKKICPQLVQSVTLMNKKCKTPSMMTAILVLHCLHAASKNCK